MREGKQKPKKFSCGDQLKAVFIKSFIFQKRQIKTNVCQALFPVALILLLFILQVIVKSILVTQLGEFAPEVIAPSISPKFTTTPAQVADVQKDCKATGFGLDSIDTTNGRFMVVTNNFDTEIGTSFNLQDFTINAIANISANISVNSNDLLLPLYTAPNTTLGHYFSAPALPPNMTMNSLFTFALLQMCPLSFEGRAIPSQGNRIDICYAQPRILVPFFSQAPTKEAADEILFNDWGVNVYVGGYNFKTVDPVTGTFDIAVYYNNSMTRGADVPIWINRIVSAIWRQYVPNGTSFEWAGNKGMPAPKSPIVFDLISLIGPSIYIFVFQLLFPVFLTSLVFEKENKLREIMKMMGLKTEIYWFVTYVFFLFLYIVATLILYGVAYGLDFRYFRVNSPGLLILFLFVWGNTLIALAFLLSVFMTKARSATVIGYLILILSGLLAQQVISPILDEPDTPRGTIIGISVIPQFAFFRGLRYFRDAVAFGGTGMTVANMKDYGLDDVLIFLAVQWGVFMILAIYFELILPIGPGVKRHPLFCFPKSCYTSTYDVPSDVQEPEDVARERKDTLLDEDATIRVMNINKVYEGGCSGNDHVAVHNLTMHIKNGECFGFLGPNGAGKSTTINMLGGYLRPTGGTAYIKGVDIKTDIDSVRLQLGVCPQENILWDDLTGPEHLYFFGRLKNLRGKELDEAVEYWMEQVNLTKAKKKFSRQYSGGMKRRLCVAIAMIGNPAVVLLDEPTTGLDPASKQSLWEVVNNYKRKCAMMLTTHSMEEAEALCDRLGIFVGGRLATLGTSQDLKSRYGSGYRMVVTTPLTSEDGARAFIKQLLPTATLLNTLAGTQQYELPRAGIKLSTVFKQISQNADKYGIVDWGISNTTLEEVFLYITEKVEKGAVNDALKALNSNESVKKDRSSSSSSSSYARKPKKQVEKSESEERESEEKSEEKSASASASVSLASAASSASASAPSRSDHESASGSGTASGPGSGSGSDSGSGSGSSEASSSYRPSSGSGSGSGSGSASGSGSSSS